MMVAGTTCLYRHGHMHVKEMFDGLLVLLAGLPFESVST